MPTVRVIAIVICRSWVLPITQAVIRVFVIFYTNAMTPVVSRMNVVVKVDPKGCEQIGRLHEILPKPW